MTTRAKAAPKSLNSIFSSSEYISTSSREYAIYICDTRGIPSVIDGLKTSQRIALWLLRNRAEKLKTAALVGLMSYEKLYVHGEASAGNAISFLAAPFKNNVPLIQGEGSFGSRINPDGIGAPRYTEVKRSKAAEAFLYNDLADVPLVPNYDGSTFQPLHFLPLIPTVLLNGVEGIAVGYSTSILRRNLKDLIQATIDVVQGKKPKPLKPYYEGYDLGVKNVGPSQWEFTGKVQIKDTSTLVVTELPPGLKLEDFRKRLIQMEETKEGGSEPCPHCHNILMDFDDNSSEGINVEIRMKRGVLKGSPAHTHKVKVGSETKTVKIPAVPAWTVEKAIDYLKLREKVTERIVVLDWNLTSIVVYDDTEQLVRDFVKFRLGAYVTRYERLLAEANKELVFWKLIKAMFENGFTKKLGTFANKAAVVAEVEAGAKKAKLKPEEDQIERAVGLATHRWNTEFKAEVEEKIKALEADVIEHKDTLKKPEKIKAIYVSELEALKKLK